MLYRTHLVGDDERWDALAWAYYQDPYDYERIQRANPTVPRNEVIPAGTRLRIPVLESTTATITTKLPPWLIR